MFTKGSMDMIVQPECCEFILDKITERNILNVTAAARAGVDYMMTGGDVACQTDLTFSLNVLTR